MYRKIVLAYDGSEAGAAALRQGTALAAQLGAELHVLGVAATGGGLAIAESVGADDVWGREQRELARLLQAAADDARVQGLQVTTCLRQGHPPGEIAAYVREIGADLLVLGHSEKGIFARWLQGSVGAALLSELPCSLLVAMDVSANN